MNVSSTEPRGTAALLVNSRGQYLLHLRDANKPHICDPGTWSVPGGGREGEETCREAVERELLEETGLTVPLEPLSVVNAHGPGTGEGPNQGQGQGQGQDLIQVYLGEWDGDADALPCPEGIMFRWFDAATTAWLTMCPWTAEVIALHRRTAPVPAPRPADPPARAGGSGARLNIVGVHLYLQRPDGRILLGLRHPAVAFAGRTWHFLAGHCETEGARASLIREAGEEAGLTIAPEDVELVHTVHILDEDGDGQPRLQLVFRAHAWSGTPEVREPDKCLEWGWFDPGRLPEPVVGYTRAAIEAIGQGRTYTELGWAQPHRSDRSRPLPPDGPPHPHPHPHP
ncbi:NUDIX domain-containing protein [Streptomyces sp. NPDC058622]|uniref:NUDIX hydrolase n=1 Tax=Streptomyces sp. NPDC058622 TaxID=3346562 RepID=UPI00364B6822